jgi:uncharacterized protein YigE (DUF2233 family)
MAKLMRAAVALMSLIALLARAEGAPADPCAQKIFEGSRFTVCMFDARADDAELIWRDSAGQALRGFGVLEASGRIDAGRVRFAMNAGMFEQSGAPLGLFVAGGKADRGIRTDNGNGNFFLKPNGVLLFDAQDRVRVVTTGGYLRLHRRRLENVPRWATQSGPMLVIDGHLHPSFQRDGASRLVRNGVGVRDTAHALFAISDDPVSFGKFARFFRDALHCRNALYLDGVVSSLWAPALGRKDSRYPLGPMIVVSERAAE